MKVLGSIPALVSRFASVDLWARAAAMALVVTIAVGCSGGDGDQVPGAVADSTDSAGLSATDPGADEAADDGAVLEVGPTADNTLEARIVDLGPANGIPDAPIPTLKPVSISIEKIGVSEADVLGVGIEPNGEMEVPPPLDVGWYQYGPTPGDQGSAVLAGHIASGGIDGAFRYLDRVEVNDIVEVAYGDRSTNRFKVTAVEQYEKYSLPFDNVFAEDGEPQLVLITCGGDFDSDARSYADNVVVYAVPVNA